MGGRTLGRVAAVLALGCALTPAPAPAAKRAKDGPVVTQADPFTTTAPGLRAGQIELTTTSQRPGLISGDRARVEVRGLGDADRLSVRRNGRRVAERFAPVPGRPGAYDAVVTGLRQGRNRIEATVRGPAGTRRVRLIVTAHPLQGPVISGPHQYPFGCGTVKAGLGKPKDRDCDADPRASWYARMPDTTFKKLADPYAPYPAGTQTTTVDGRTVPFVVRVETRVINRSITRIAVLDDPRARGRGAPFRPARWNHKMLFQFGESCGTGYHQGSNTETAPFGQLQEIGGENLAGPFLDLAGHLGRGWMVSASSLTIFGVHCNAVLSAETLMMIKEHVIDDYGRVDRVIGGGASGGAIQQYTIANQYPGVLDAGVPILSFPDVISTAMTVADCIGMTRVFGQDPRRWDDARQRAVTGLATGYACRDWVDLFGDNLKPTSCDGSVPKADRYDPQRNPKGVRCDLQDNQRNITGVDPRTGLARRPLDNTGVQYGLAALRRGDITIGDFLTLNRDIGGFDADGNHQAARHAMTAQEAGDVFARGQISGYGALRQTPIIDIAIPVSDVTPTLDIHDQIRPYGLRARLDALFGGHASQAIWNVLPLPSSAVDTADSWAGRIDDLQAAQPGLSREQLVAQARPFAAADQCRVGVVGVPGLCDTGVLRHSSPRQQAGAPFSEDVIKCHLKAVDPADYPAAVTPAQLDAIRAIFPQGVCDWSRPSVGADAAPGAWLAYGDPDRREQPRSVGWPVVRSQLP